MASSVRQFAWLLTCLGGSASFADDSINVPPTPNLQTIHRHWAEWRSRFGTIRVKGRQWDIGNVRKYNDVAGATDDELRSQFVTTWDFTWSDRFGVRSLESHSKRGIVDNRGHRGSNRSVGWQSVTRPESAADHWDTIATFRPIPDRPLAMNTAVTLVNPLWDADHGCWFDESWSRGAPPRIVGWEMLAEARVLNLTWTNEHGSPFGISLDPARSFLPVRVTRYRTSGNLFWTWTALEFREVEPGFLFPVRAVQHLNNEPDPGFELQVDDVAINLPMTPADFQPPRPDPGTQLMDHIDGRITRAPGGAPPVPPTTPSMPPPSPATALPDQSAWGLWLWAAGAVSLGGAIWLIHHRWRRSSPM